MQIQIPPEEINGDLPEIEGFKCEALLCQEFWYDGVLDDAANVVYLKVRGFWHRLYFDHGLVLWRFSDEPPRVFAPEVKENYKILDLGKQLGLEGEVLSEVKISPGESRNIVTFIFGNKLVLQIYGAFDDTSGWVAA